MLKFPYGNSNFEDIISANYYYVDRTGHIPLLEEAGKNLLFLRPRRFGKSLLLSMLENYYDVAKADRFESLFGGLVIGQKPTPRHNQYFVLKWDFSTIDPQGDTDEIKQALHNHINGCIEQFRVHYRDHLEYEIELDKQDALRSLQSVLAAVEQTPYKLYLLIDEYDNFANEVLMSRRRDRQERYENLLYGEGALKTVFKAIKAMSQGRGVDRVFITGVSPVVMSDLTSGFNIAENIYLEPAFNDLCGFWEEEVAAILQQVVTGCQETGEQEREALAMMRAFYNGYSFSYEAEPALYNPTLVLYFVKAFQRHCRYPRRVLDENLAMDRGKITYISQLPHGEQVISRILNETETLSVAELGVRFGVKEMLYGVKDEQLMVSLLYYFGVLTLTGHQTRLGKLIFTIPNLVVRSLYVERIYDLLAPDFSSRKETQQAAEQFYQSGAIGPLCDLIEQRYFKLFDNRDYRWANELTIKTLFLTLLFNDTFYIVDSETALERSYADMTLIVRPDMRQFELLDFLLEFKYVSLSRLGLTGAEVKQMSEADLWRLGLVQESLTGAVQKLAGYRATLAARYGALLRLRVYSVIAIGYERVLWREVTQDDQAVNEMD